MSEALLIDDGLPLVGEDRGNRGLWIGLGGIVITGILFFAMLESNRKSNTQPVFASTNDYAIASAPRAELAIPQSAPISALEYPLLGSQLAPAPTPAPASANKQPILPPVQLERVQPSIISPSDPSQSIPQPYTPPLPPIQPAAPDPGRSAPGIVYDAVQAAVAAISNATGQGATGVQAAKAMAVGGGDRTHLVSQGTLIFGVLETAIDSTQSGQVRAMISNNVFNALGTQVLIARGSRIFGEYKSDLGSGQNRAQIIWTRLIRPDGATISLDSPASDQLGRAGVKGNVNSHFGERLLNALLQSSLDFGAGVASRAVTGGGGVILALPSASREAGSGLIQPPPKPTLKVRHGTGISVFVARDLDFSAVE